MSSSDDNALYSIAAVSKLTGLSCHTLRVWERRYGFPIPYRSASGHRRYATEDVARLRQLAVRLREGSGRGVRELLKEIVETEPQQPRPKEEVASSDTTKLLNALFQGEMEAAEQIWLQQTANRTAEQILTQVLEPSLVDAGEALFRGSCRLSQERLAHKFLLRKTYVLLDQCQNEVQLKSRRVVVGTVTGDRHEGGALLVSIALELAGCRAIYLGTDLPTLEFQNAINFWNPIAVAISFVLSRNINRRFAELEQLKGAPVFVGGRSILNYQSLATKHGLFPQTGNARAAVAAMLERTNTFSYDASFMRCGAVNDRPSP